MKKILNLFNNLDSVNKKIMSFGFKICFYIVLISSFMLIKYLFSYNIFYYNLGLTFFKLGTYFFVEFIVCGFVCNKIKEQLS